MQSFADEIFQQPAALDDLMTYYTGQDLSAARAAYDQPGVLLVGMGASNHAARIAAYRQQQKQPTMRVVEAADTLLYNPGILSACSLLVYISQSGASGEIEPLFRQLPEQVRTVGITNTTDSALGAKAGTVLPLCAGEEYTVATKTYLNTLALLHLLGGGGMEALGEIREQVEALLRDAETIQARWIEALATAKTLYFLGHGPHYVTARHCAMMVGEWAKRPVFHGSIGAFRHGYIEAVERRTGVVIFAPPGASARSAQVLADELAWYGADVLMVENGRTRKNNEPAQGVSLNEYLSPMLDVIPGQLFAEALARHDGIPAGFRYISKVVKKL